MSWRRRGKWLVMLMPVYEAAIKEREEVNVSAQVNQIYRFFSHLPVEMLPAGGT